MFGEISEAPTPWTARAPTAALAGSPGDHEQTHSGGVAGMVLGDTVCWHRLRKYSADAASITRKRSGGSTMLDKGLWWSIVPRSMLRASLASVNV